MLRRILIPDIMFRRVLIPASLAAVLIALAGCGSTPTERGITGAGIGALGGAAVGEPVGGALIGGGVGVFTDEEDLDLGEPIWKW